MAGRLTLDQLVVVRIHCPQPDRSARGGFVLRTNPAFCLRLIFASWSFQEKIPPPERKGGWSGWAASNRRLPRPKRGALANCATPRAGVSISVSPNGVKNLIQIQFCSVAIRPLRAACHAALAAGSGGDGEAYPRWRGNCFARSDIV